MVFPQDFAVAEHLSLYLPHWLAYTVAALVHAALLINVIAVGALVFIWMERKIAGRIQDRLGPTRVGGKFGWLQTLADGIKLISKEDLMPNGADGLLFRLAPYISFCASFTAYLALPFADGWVGQRLNVAVFFILAVMGLEVFGVILAGYSSASKWSLFGSMREAAQVVSYEVPMGLCVVVPVLICGTMDLITIGNMQAGWFTNWLVFHDPFTFITFWVYFTCATASVNRAPFDLAEAESELVAGFHTEYSGLRWSFFFMAEYGSMFAVSGLAAILFFGGWNGPIPITHLLGMAYEPGESVHFAGYLANLLGMTNFMIKACLFVTLMMWVRWTLPRLRIDQVMTTCLKYCTPIAAFMFLGAVAWTYFLPGGVGLRYQPYAFVPESSAYVSPLQAFDTSKASQPEEPVARQSAAGSPEAAAVVSGRTAAVIPGRTAAVASPTLRVAITEEAARGSH
jgi:NADH-quinone oxidoreductase subunit H